MGSVAHKIGARNLLIIIVTMPVVFLVVVALIIMVFGSPNDRQREAAPASSLVRSMPASQNTDNAKRGQRAMLAVPAANGALGAAIALPDGARAGAISLDGDRLAVAGRSCK